MTHRTAGGRTPASASRGWEILEERLQGGRIVGVEGCDALRVELERCSLEAFRIAPGEDDAVALGAGSPGGFQPDAGAAADDDDGVWPSSSGSRWVDTAVVAVVIIPPVWCGRPVTKWPPRRRSHFLPGADTGTAANSTLLIRH
jgi:hypothetical protein